MDCIEKAKDPKFRALVNSFIDPASYAESELGMKLHPKQAAVLRDLFPRTKGKKTRVSLRKANEVGGTRTVITAAVLFALDILQAEVISTAGKWLQVSTQLIPSLRSHQRKFPRWEFQDTGVKINGAMRYIGFSTTSGFAQGFHRTEGKPLVGIIDEAGLVDKGIFDDIEDRCSPDYFLVAGAPMEPAGAFYDIETRLARFYSHHHISQYDCLKENGYWIDKADIERKIAKWGTGHPFIASNVEGEFAAVIENGLMSLKDFNMCLENNTEWKSVPDDIHLFIDVGRTNVAALRQGNKVWIEKKWWSENPPAATGQIIMLATRLKKEIGLTPQDISIDGGGEWGKEVGDNLFEAGWYVNKWHGNQEPIDQDYQNAASEAWIAGSVLIKNCDMIIPNNDEFRHQCLTRRKKAHPSGRQQIEPKDEYIKRGFDSPHEADALFGAMTRLNKSKTSNLGGSQEKDTRGWVERAQEEEDYSDDNRRHPERCL